MSGANDAKDHASLLQSVSVYYGDKLEEFGPTARGVDWNSEESQRLRFAQLLRIADGAESFSINDFGCGYGALLDVLQERSLAAEYAGYDVCPTMIAAARQRHADARRARFTDRSDLVPADYTVASGIFNVKLDHGDARWRDYVLDTIAALGALSTRGFAFNMLTSYSDPSRQRSDLYYADPREMFDHCKRMFGRVALLHDYPLFEFTMLVRK
jgi:SAM-dependent methyltransferase